MKIMSGKTKYQIQNEKEKSEKNFKEQYIELKLREDYSLEEELDMIRNAINSIVQYFKMPDKYLPQNFKDIQTKITKLREEADGKTKS